MLKKREKLTCVDVHKYTHTYTPTHTHTITHMLSVVHFPFRTSTNFEICRGSHTGIARG